MMGNMLRDRDQQFIAHRDEATHTWRILDSWHETLGSYSVDDDVPDDSQPKINKLAILYSNVNSSVYRLIPNKNAPTQKPIHIGHSNNFFNLPLAGLIESNSFP